ncbi:hypothetical protein [Methylobacterium sp. A54F]
MSGVGTDPGGAWDAEIARAYAAETKPPLTPELVDRVRHAVADLALGDGATLDEPAIARVNEALDAFEVSLEAVAGPRLVSAQDRSVRMAHRSEAGRPLRSFGGQ